jgi:hypothetical protein
MLQQGQLQRMCDTVIVVLPQQTYVSLAHGGSDRSQLAAAAIDARQHSKVCALL